MCGADEPEFNHDDFIDNWMRMYLEEKYTCLNKDISGKEFEDELTKLLFEQEIMNIVSKICLMMIFIVINHHCKISTFAMKMAKQI